MAKKEVQTKKDYVCPYCFTKVDMNNIHYICTGPTCAKTFASNAISSRNEKEMMYVSKNGVNEIDRE
ncbi:MAG: hypothetical protein IJV47_02950, partial [Candidatus Methanomethylophilaceae archaeon]|nr:hypothetical protein [Candidatus Methanomethylophilaceae archaeon]